jgi:hypothetical protein
MRLIWYVPATPMRAVARGLAFGAMLVLEGCLPSTRRGTGCEDCAARVTSSLPTRFTRLADSTGTSCPPAIADPADGARLALVRVMPRGRADYEVAGRYGAREGEVIRIHCVDGTVAGLVPR